MVPAGHLRHLTGVAVRRAAGRAGRATPSRERWSRTPDRDSGEMT